MRFTTFLVSGALAAVAVAQSATTSASVPESSAQACLNKCKSGDVDCQAHCITVPSPDAQNVADTHKCVANCPQGSGSAADTDKYSICVQGCIRQHYYVSSEGTPNATGGTGKDNSGSGSGSDSAATATGTGASPTGSASGTRSGSGSQTTGSGSESGSQTGTGASATKTGAASGLTFGSSGAFVGALAALLAL